MDGPGAKLDDVRYELKMVAPARAAPQVTMWLNVHPAGFRVAYPRRRVNNIYFDSADLTSYAENLAGIARRVKARLRWYGDDNLVVKSGTFELKCKRGLAGWKLQHSLVTPLDLTTTRWTPIIDTIRAELPPHLCRALDRADRAVLINRYSRDYYVSADGTVRVTVDSGETVYPQLMSSRPNLRTTAPGRDIIVIELKTLMSRWERLAEMLGAFPFLVEKHSKYVAGVDAIHSY